jgi:hypothetical protein
MMSNFSALSRYEQYVNLTLKELTNGRQQDVLCTKLSDHPEELTHTISGMILNWETWRASYASEPRLWAKIILTQ